MPEQTESDKHYPYPSPPKFHKLHYNFVAKRLREAFDMSDMAEENGVTRMIQLTNHAVLSDLAVSFAKKFKEDNPSFDPLRFLDACSPDTDLYPFSELWDDEWVPQDC